MNFITDKELEYYDNNLVHELHIEDWEFFFRYASLLGLAFFASFVVKARIVLHPLNKVFILIETQRNTFFLKSMEAPNFRFFYHPSIV